MDFKLWVSKCGSQSVGLKVGVSKWVSKWGSQSGGSGKKIMSSLDRTNSVPHEVVINISNMREGVASGLN